MIKTAIAALTTLALSGCVIIDADSVDATLDREAVETDQAVAEDIDVHV